MNHRSNQTAAGLSRRALIKGAAAVGAYTLLPKIGGSEAFAAEATHTLVIAAPATPQSLDHEFDVSRRGDSLGASRQGQSAQLITI
jgi:peptide/nickel transport system substrate-binding protein